jgi:hypothetical protein
MNLQYWDKLRQPPKEALKKITGGRLKGMTDISPIWRIKAVTEVFGPCGIGWKFKSVKKWIEQGSDDQALAFVDVEVFIKVDGEWSEPIPGNGGSMLIAKEKHGPFSSDEAYKMATTDALSSAFKMLGVAADVYAGAYDGSKYNLPEPVPENMQFMTKEQSEKLITFCLKEKLDPQEIAVKYGITKQMRKIAFDNTFDKIEKAVEVGDIGYRFAVAEGETPDDELL